MTRCNFRGDSEELEEKYESQLEHEQLKRVKVKHMLPTKTRDGGLIPQVIEQEYEEHVEEVAKPLAKLQKVKKEETLEPMTAAQLLTARSETLASKQQEIGLLSSSVLENPDEKVGNLQTLLHMMDEYIPEVFLTIKKLVMVSLLEIFKDILPSYQLKQHDGNKDVKCKFKLLICNIIETFVFSKKGHLCAAET